MKLWSAMWGRVFVILLLGVVITAILTWWLANNERQRTLSEYRDNHAQERIEQLVVAMDALPAQDRSLFLEKAPPLGLAIAYEDFAQRPRKLAQTAYARQLIRHLQNNFAVYPLGRDPQACPPESDTKNIAIRCEALGVRLRDGMGLRITVIPPRPPAPVWRTNFSPFLYLVLGSLILFSYLIARMSMRPLQKMAAAAAALGQDIDRPPLAEQGTNEIIQATRAFNAMQARIRQNITQRTQMLAAITHDLQTPLTRMRLRLEKVRDDELRDRLINDLGDMQILIKEGLELARSLDTNEAMQTLDLDSLLDSICADASDAGQAVTYQGCGSTMVMARPQALKRCLSNLIDNAIKYGEQAQVSLQLRQNKVIVKIADKGPGIPEAFLEKVLEPFFRLESSRSRESGGTGLGLSIAQNIAQQHGSSLRLTNQQEGGLLVSLSLPLLSSPLK